MLYTTCASAVQCMVLAPQSWSRLGSSLLWMQLRAMEGQLKGVAWLSSCAQLVQHKTISDKPS